MKGGVGARFGQGEVRYPDTRALREDLDLYLAHGVIRASGDGLPRQMEVFPFRLLLPDGATLELRGQVIRSGGAEVLIQVDSWTPSVWDVVRAASHTPASVPAVALPTPPPTSPAQLFSVPASARPAAPPSATGEAKEAAPATAPVPAGASRPAPAAPPASTAKSSLWDFMPKRAAAPAPAPSSPPARSAELPLATAVKDYAKERATAPAEGRPGPGPRDTPMSGTSPLPLEAAVRAYAKANVEPSSGAPSAAPARDAPRLVSAPVALPPGKLAGSFKAPPDLTSFRALPLRPDQKVREAGASSTVVTVLRWLAAARATGSVVLDGHRQITIPIVDGRARVPERERNAIYEAIGWPTGTWSFVPGPAAGEASSSVGMWNLAVGMAKRQIREYPMEAISAALPTAEAPSVQVAGERLIPALGLSGAELRFIDNRLHGKEVLHDLSRAAGMSDIGLLRLMLLLDLIGALEWHKAAAHDQIAEETNDLKGLYDRRCTYDCFRQIGMHYSDAPSQLQKGYLRFQRDLAPASEAAKKSPEFAKKLLELGAAAWKVISERESRQRYRKEKLSLNVEAMAMLLFEQAKMEKMRGEIPLARQMLEQALDLHPAEEYVSYYRNMPTS